MQEDGGHQDAVVKEDKHAAQDPNEENYEEEEEEEEGNADKAANGRAEMWGVGKQGQLDSWTLNLTSDLLACSDE